MLKFLKRNELVRRGLSCGKTRRRRPNNELARFLECSNGIKTLILCVFLIVLSYLLPSGDFAFFFKRLLIGSLILATAVAQLWINHNHSFAQNSRLALILGVIFIQLGATKACLIYGLAYDEIRPLIFLAIPHAFAPLTLSVLLGRNHGLYAATFASLLGSILHEKIDAFLLVIGLISGFTAVFLTLQVRRRARLIRAGFFAGLATCVLYMAFGLIAIPPVFGNGVWVFFVKQVMVAVASGILTATLVGGLLPVFESAFGVTTDISWLEMADLNHPLLSEMSLRAPGTYYHSMAVAQLAEAAAERIGANDTICRVCAYFHDIGKLVKPEYFTENIPPGRSPHDDLTPTMSALIILAHVKEGVDLALKHKLNQTIVDVIQQHHGTSLVTYFYQRSLRIQEDARRGGKITNMREEDIPGVCEDNFRYSGPKPQFPESGIISLADSVESASRSLANPTPQKIEQLVDDIIETRIAERQLDDCELTLAEIWEIADSFKATLASMLHRRISYDEPQPAATQVNPSGIKAEGAA